jgi:predicted dehydrogenase
MQWGFTDGRIAQIFTSSRNDSPFAALVTGTEGWISIEPRIHRATRLVIGGGPGEPEVVAAPRSEGNGYRLEVEEVARCLRAGELESPLVPLDDTVAILEVLDEARRQLGVRYPADA